MKVAWMERFGDPAEVLACQELPEPDAAGPGEVVLQLAASPINPADFFLIQGIYAILPNLPYAICSTLKFLWTLMPTSVLSAVFKEILSNAVVTSNR